MPPRTERLTWPRSRRLARHDDVRQVLRRGQSFSGGWFRLFFWPEPAGDARFAVSVRKTIGNACARNRARRQLRESLRVAHDVRPRRGWGVIIIDRVAPRNSSGSQRQDAVRQLLKRAQALAESRHS